MQNYSKIFLHFIKISNEVLKIADFYKYSLDFNNKKLYLFKV